MARKQNAAGLTVAMSFLEIHEGGNGFMRFLVRQDHPTRWRALEVPQLEVRVRDESGRACETREDSSGSSMGPTYASLEANASLLVFDLPDSGEIEVSVTRVTNLKMENPYHRLRMRLWMHFEWLLPSHYVTQLWEEGRKEGLLSRFSRRLFGEEGPSWQGPWTFRLHI